MDRHPVGEPLMARISQERFAIRARDPQTGHVQAGLPYAQRQTVGQVFAFLLQVDPKELTCYTVVDQTGRGVDAESWMEEHPADHVAHVWTSAHANVRGAVETLWPQLHLALTNLEVNHLPPVLAVDPLLDADEQYWTSRNGTRKHLLKWEAGVRGESGGKPSEPVSFCGRDLILKLTADQWDEWGLVCTICVKNKKIHLAGGPK